MAGMTVAPIEFSVQSAPRDARSWTELARRCESTGVRALLVADHPGSGPAPFVALGAAAAVTSTLRLGSYVVNAGVREAVHIAVDVATLDVVSDGRAEVGLGAGHTPVEWEMIGRRRPSPRERVDRLCETAATVRHLLDGDVVPAGRSGSSTEMQLDEPRPVQPKVPMLLGGTSATLLRWAGAHADAVGLTGLGRTRPDGHRHDVAWSAGQVDRHVSVVREAAGTAGRAGPAIEALVQVMRVTDEREEVLDRLAPRLELPPQDLAGIPYVLVGTVDQIAGQLATARERWGITRYVVRDDAVDDAEAVIAALRG